MKVVGHKTLYAMKRLVYYIASAFLCSFCGPYVQQAAAQTTEPHLRSTTHEERAERRAERLAEYEKFIDSLVLSHNFEFNAQTVAMDPSIPMRILTNPNYIVTVWRGQMDVCLPYYTGVVPPYRYVLMNTGSPLLSDYIVVQTSYGWNVSFKTTLYAESEYTFDFEIYSHGGATLTISNTWYNPVQYTGTITKIY